MIEIMNTDTGMKIEPYVSLLKEEPLIRNNLAVLIHTLIELAVADGNYILDILFLLEALWKERLVVHC